MSTFLYWIPTNKPTVDRETVERFGLAYALPGSVIARQCYQGPAGGVVGAVLIAGEAVGKANHGYFASEQAWEKIDGSEAWVGWETKNPPKPEGLERAKMTPLRKSIELCDGNQWECPIAQRPELRDGEEAPVRACRLPRKIVYKNGDWILGELREADRELWRVTNETFDQLNKLGEGTSLVLNVESAVTALSANYRIGRTEVGILGLFESDCKKVFEVLKALVDWDGWESLIAGESTAVA